MVVGGLDYGLRGPTYEPSIIIGCRMALPSDFESQVHYQIELLIVRSRFGSTRFIEQTLSHWVTGRVQKQFRQTGLATNHL